MGRYSNRRFSPAGAAITAILLLLTCCTTAQYDMGELIIPRGENMKIHFSTLTGGISTYNTKTDYIPGNNVGYALFGKARTDGFGTTTAGSMFQLSYYYRSDGGKTQGCNYVCDSVWIFTNVDFIGGPDSLSEQTFLVYEAKKPIERDSTYYSNLDWKEFACEEPMFRFRYSGKPFSTTQDTLMFEMVNEERAHAYMDRLGRVDTTYYYFDTLFPTNFYGMVVVPESSTGDGAIYGMNLSYSNGSYMRTFGHNYKIDDPTAIKDTIERTFTMCDDNQHTKNKSLNFLSHDYSQTDITWVPERITDLGEPVSKAYIHGLGGVTTTLQFSDDFIARLKALCPEDCEMVINQARMYLPMRDPSADVMDAAPKRVGTYLDYGAQINTVDYNYSYEDYIQYDGYLNRTHGYYMINVENQLQRLFQDTGYAPKLTAGMLHTDMYTTLTEVELIGSAERDIRVDITYTLITKPR